MVFSLVIDDVLIVGVVEVGVDVVAGIDADFVGCLRVVVAGPNASRNPLDSTNSMPEKRTKLTKILFI